MADPGAQDPGADPDEVAPDPDETPPCPAGRDEIPRGWNEGDVIPAISFVDHNEERVSVHGKCGAKGVLILSATSW